MSTPAAAPPPDAQAPAAQPASSAPTHHALPQDPAQALRAHANRVLQDAHFVHLLLGLGVLAALGLVLGPDLDARRASVPALGLSAVQRGLAVGWLAGAINLSLLIWIGQRLMAGRLGDSAEASPSGRGTAAFAASIKLILLGLVLWLGWQVWAADPAGLVLGVSLAPLALAYVGLRFA